MRKKTNTPAVPKPAKSKSARAKFRTEECLAMVKHTFTDAERIQVGSELTAAMSTKANIETELETLKKDYKSRITTIEQSISQLHSKFHDGYEMRNSKVIVHFNMATENGKPVKRPGMKRIVLEADKSHVRDEPMSPSDLQTEMFEKQKLAEDSAQAKANSKAKDTGEKPLNAPDVPNTPGTTTSTAATA